MKRTSIIIFVVALILSIGLLGLAVKGQIGNPLYYQTQLDTRVGGPFEASNSTSRYALTMSIVDSHSFFLTDQLARFSSPDVVNYRGKNLSIFTPGISLVGVPFYVIGKAIGYPQLLTYFTNALIALLNMVLVILIARKLGARMYSSILSGFLFLFGTNAFSYALSYTQHHLSILVVLLALLNALGKRNVITNIYLGALVGLGVLFDIPNSIMMTPMLLYVLYRQFPISIDEKTKKLTLKIKLSIIGILIGIIPFVAFFGYYNYQTTGSYTKISQFIGRSSKFSVQPVQKVKAPVPTEKPTQSFSLPFNTRSQLSGLYTLVLSDERSWLFYSPVVLLGIIGLVVAYRRKETRIIAVLCLSIALVDLVLYSMFGDPWGGWSFGPRYLLPAAAVVSSGLGLALDRFRKNIFFVIFFILVALYSLGVNTLGALTTNSIPPKVEALRLSTHIPYTYAYNMQLIAKDQSSSLVYNMFFAQHIDLNIYLYTLMLLLFLPTIVLIVVIALQKCQEHPL